MSTNRPPSQPTEREEPGLFTKFQPNLEDDQHQTITNGYSSLKSHESQQIPRTNGGSHDSATSDPNPPSSTSRTTARTLPEVNGVRLYNHRKTGPDAVLESYTDERGEYLTSVKAEEGDERDNVRRSELVSGRRAGAGWERSG